MFYLGFFVLFGRKNTSKCDWHIKLENYEKRRLVTRTNYGCIFIYLQINANQVSMNQGVTDDDEKWMGTFVYKSGISPNKNVVFVNR